MPDAAQTPLDPAENSKLALPPAQPRSGYLSSEFVIAILALIGVLVLSGEGKLSGEATVTAVTLILGSFSAVRTYLKKLHLDVAFDLAAQLVPMKWKPAVSAIDRELQAPDASTSSLATVTSVTRSEAGHVDRDLICGMSGFAIVILLALAFYLSGCAGSAIDRDFRSKVQSADIHGTAEFDPQTKATRGTLDTTITFRDPRTEGLSK